MEVISVGSSSSGNSYIITTENSTVIIDVGLPAKRIITALHQIGRSPEDVEAILITHEHVDHVRSVRAMGRQCPNALFYASKGTVESTENFKYIDDNRIRIVSTGDAFSISDGSPGTEQEMETKPEIGVFSLCHDAAEPVGFTFSDGAEKLAVVTDSGIVTDEIFEAVKDSDILIFESNHDENMLMYGSYPYPVKVRIKSELGHLSNEYAGEVLARLLRDRQHRLGDEMYHAEQEENAVSAAVKPLQIMLAHLSFNNNAPFFARQAVEEALEAAGFERDVHYNLTIASKEEITVINCGD